MEEIKSIDDLVSKVTNISLPWEDFCTAEITEWLHVFSRAHGTRKELTLSGILSTVCVLMGKTELKLFSTYKERANLFFYSPSSIWVREDTCCTDKLQLPNSKLLGVQNWRWQAATRGPLFFIWTF